MLFSNFKHLAVLSLFGSLVLCSCTPYSSSKSLSPKEQQVLKQLRLYVAGTLQTLRPCSAGIVVSRGDEIIYEEYLPGMQPQKPQSTINENSLWPVFSVTKSFVAGMLLSLAKDGKIALDDPVSKYLPEFVRRADRPYDRHQVTIRHLASHTSGVHLSREDANRDISNQIIDLNDVQIITEPGKVFLYSGLGMYILERTIEAATDEDFSQTMSKRILGPLGLVNTRYIYEYNPQIPMLPCKDGDSEDPTEHFSTTSKGERAGSGLYTTTRELNLYSRLWLGDGTFKGRKYFDAELKKQVWKFHGMRATDSGRYGLLWWLFEAEGGYVMSGGGYSVSAVVPESNVVVTVTRNHLGPISAPFNYYEDKKTLVLFAKRLGNN